MVVAIVVKVIIVIVLLGTGSSCYVSEIVVVVV